MSVLTLLADLEDGWEIAIVAATSPRRRIEGLTKANKVLARLQREGFPIGLQFRNIQMGPASQELLPRAQRAERRGHLRIETVPLRAEGLDDRIDFVLTDAGLGYVKDTVLPAMKEHSKSDLLHAAFRRAFEACQHLPTSALVHEAHDSLHLDDRPVLLGTYLATRRELEDRFARVEAAGRPRDRFALTVGATLDFAVEAIVAIEPGISDPHDNSTGKNHVLALCEELVDLLGQMDRLEPLRLAKGIEPDLERVLNALEVNCGIYGLVPVITDEDMARMLAEVPPSDPNTAHD